MGSHSLPAFTGNTQEKGILGNVTQFREVDVSHASMLPLSPQLRKGKLSFFERPGVWEAAVELAQSKQTSLWYRLETRGNLKPSMHSIQSGKCSAWNESWQGRHGLTEWEDLSLKQLGPGRREHECEADSPSNSQIHNTLLSTSCCPL